ncbi:MAG: small ribosomal subunit Rsm22 family protein [bacterium]|nr:small ribosomal subunit Rsm22 family protein [bacterium]
MTDSPLSDDQLHRIGRLRELFLDDSRGGHELRDYWRGPEDLAAYDAVLAARIGWKWDAALTEAIDRGLAVGKSPSVLDFGCGSGIAARRFAAHFTVAEIGFHDRSPHAMEFARSEFGRELPAVPARSVADVTAADPDVLLVSHVLGELDERGRAALRDLIARARIVVIVEPGNHPTSRRLSELRDELRGEFRVVAPCPHAEACPALAGQDWCHFFAAPPPEVFTDGAWVRAARAIGIDLRALPYAFLALVRENADQGRSESRPDGSPDHRLLGRPRIRSRDALVTACTAAGLETIAVQKRGDAATFRVLKKNATSVRSLPAR